MRVWKCIGKKCWYRQTMKRMNSKARISIYNTFISQIEYLILWLMLTVVLEPVHTINAKHLKILNLITNYIQILLKSMWRIAQINNSPKYLVWFNFYLGRRLRLLVQSRLVSLFRSIFFESLAFFRIHMTRVPILIEKLLFVKKKCIIEDIIKPMLVELSTCTYTYSLKISIFTLWFHETDYL